METVEVVIKISKNTLDAVGMLQEFVDDGYINGHHMKGNIFGIMLKAIANGTVLPKGHGKLIEADSMKRIDAIQRGDFNSIESIRAWIDIMPTVVEADKEVTNG